MYEYEPLPRLNKENHHMQYKLILSNLIFSVLFVSNIAFAEEFSLAENYYYPGRTQAANDGGAPCVFSKVTGDTVHEVAEKYVAMHNDVTSLDCFQRCSNPVRLSWVREAQGKFRIWSYCMGIGYVLELKKECYGCNAVNFGPQCE